MKKFLSIITLLVLALPLFAQAAEVDSNVVVIPLTYTYAESLTAALTGGTQLDLAAHNTVSVTATYNLFAAAHTQGIKAAFYFSSATAALSGTSNISSGSVAASIGGGSNQACNASTTGIPGAPAGNSACNPGILQILTQAQLTAAPSGTASPTTISLSFFSAPGVGTWTGNLNYVAWAP